MSSTERRCNRGLEPRQHCKANEAQSHPAGLWPKGLSAVILLLVVGAGACYLTGCVRPSRQPDHEPQVRHRPGRVTMPDLPPVPATVPMPIRWEQGPWWGDVRGRPLSVSLTNLRTRTVVLGAATASVPQRLTVQDLKLATPGPDPLSLVLVKAGTDHPLRVLDSCSVGANTTIRVDNAALEVDGTFRVGGRLDLAHGRVAANSDLLVGQSAGAPASVNVTGGTLTVTNAAHNARLVIGLDGSRGDFCLDGGTVEADSLQVIINTNNRFIFKSGTLKVQTFAVTNYWPITIPDGGRLELGDGTNLISSLLTISSNATLTGNGTICGPVANYGTIVAGQPGDLLTFAPMPPLYPSAVTNWGRMYMTNGGTLSFQGIVCNNAPSPITAMTRTGANFTFQFVSVGGLAHILESKNALGDPAWTPLVSTNGTGEILSLTVPAPTGGARFYHIRVGP
jgi:hypothetical protein